MNILPHNWYNARQMLQICSFLPNVEGEETHNTAAAVVVTFDHLYPSPPKIQFNPMLQTFSALHNISPKSVFFLSFFHSKIITKNFAVPITEQGKKHI